MLSHNDSTCVWKPTETNPEVPYPQPTKQNIPPEDSNIKYTTPSTSNPSENQHNDAGNVGVIDQEKPVGGQVLDSTMVNANNPTTKFPTER